MLCFCVVRVVCVAFVFMCCVCYVCVYVLCVLCLCGCTNTTHSVPYNPQRDCLMHKNHLIRSSMGNSTSSGPIY